MTPDSAFFGLNATSWTALVCLVTAAGVGVALFLGLRGLGASRAAADAAARAAKAAEDQGRLLADQMRARYPTLEALLPFPELRDGQTGRMFLKVRALSGEMAAVNVEAWLYNGSTWHRGGWPAVSPLQGEYRVLLDQVACSTTRDTPFGDFFEGNSVDAVGLIGVLWTRPDGRWRFVQEMANGMIPAERFEIGPVHK